ncbi:hypothetical protein [Rhizobium anhuiense]|uniref:hypothetical protein n=1 Tax=Rhizobium anhuiense TaxID=1184720 RepID=UPI001FE04213|nr:hypothetical protein [Rhizobium anhuiense]
MTDENEQKTPSDLDDLRLAEEGRSDARLSAPSRLVAEAEAAFDRFNSSRIRHSEDVLARRQS